MSNEKNIVCEEHVNKVLSNAHLGRSEDVLCDIEIRVEEKKFPAHKIVLASGSDYFKKMFTTNMKEKYSDTVEIEDLTADATEHVLDFIYTGKIKLTADNVNDILKVASYFLVENLLQIVSDYLENTLSVNTVLPLRETGHLFSLMNLSEKVEDFVVSNFSVICTQTKFVEITYDDMKKYLSMDEISASEDVMVKCLLAWVKADLPNRRKKFLPLFQLIRLQHVSVDYLLDTLRQDALVKESNLCHCLVEDAMHFHIRSTGIKQQTPRYERIQDLYLLTQSNTIHETTGGKTLFLKEKALQPTLHVSYSSALVLYNNKMYFFGGFPKSSMHATNSIISFDGKIWRNEGYLRQARANASAVCHGGKVYIFCGEDNNSMVANAEVFYNGSCGDHRFNSSYYRSCAAAVSIGEFVYLIGGYTAGKSQVNATTTYTNVNSNQTYENLYLNHGRAEFGVSTIGKKIYVCGGKSQQSGGYINSIEYLDLTSFVNSYNRNRNCSQDWNRYMKWALVQTTSVQLGITSACLLGVKQMLVLGEQTDVLQCFDLEQSTWKTHVTGKGDYLLGYAQKGSKLFRLTTYF